MSESISQYDNLETAAPPLVEDQGQLEVIISGAPEVNRKRHTLRKWAGRTALGVAVIGGGVAFATNPIEDLKNDVIESTPWVLPGVIGSEALFVGGAAMIVGSAGMAIGNPLTLKKRARGIIKDTGEKMAESTTFRNGLRVNTAGALGTAGVVMAGAVVALPPETWPGAVGLAALDMAGTVGLRAPIYRAINKEKASHEKDNMKVTVRQAKLEDIDRLADLDLALFDGAYGEEPPMKEDVAAMFTARFHNANGWMYVAEMNGQVEGFVTAFRTNKSVENFVSWEDTTADGTLNGRVDPNGKYVYVANMTIGHDAVENGAKEMLLANLFANAIEEGGIEYGYFVGRLPQFRDWLEKTGLYTEDEAELHGLAQEYMALRNEEGKPYDWQLRMYTDDGFKPSRAVANGFQDAASMNYAVPFVTMAPGRSKFFDVVPLARKAFAGALRTVARHPKLLAKVV